MASESELAAFADEINRFDPNEFTVAAFAVAGAIRVREYAEEAEARIESIEDYLGHFATSLATPVAPESWQSFHDIDQGIVHHRLLVAQQSLDGKIAHKALYCQQTERLTDADKELLSFEFTLNLSGRRFGFQKSTTRLPRSQEWSPSTVGSAVLLRPSFDGLEIVRNQPSQVDVEDFPLEETAALGAVRAIRLLEFLLKQTTSGIYFSPGVSAIL